MIHPPAIMPDHTMSVVTWRAPRDRPKQGKRLSGIALQALKAWLESHNSHPYPNEDEKLALEEATGLKAQQINNWFANARRLRKQRDMAALQGTPISDQCNERRSPGLSSGGKACVSDCAIRQHGRVDNGYHDRTMEDPTRPMIRMYQCTFCTDTFMTKYSWIRHETSLHISLTRYICCPFSPVVKDPSTEVKTCSYCGLTEPTAKHIETHKHTYCQERAPETRVFTRKDHLRQHLRMVHGCEALPNVDSWILEAKFINSRCGFCGEKFTEWSVRNEHIAAHFKQGYGMESWRGCRGLDTSVFTLVTAAMPPFLIGIERLSPHPFSASAKTYGPVASGFGGQNSTEWSALKNLAIELHRLTLEMSARCIMVSDEDLKNRARLLVHGTSQSQARTAADNPEWLDLFKRALCLNIIPTADGQSNIYIPADLEIYHDLGLQLPPILQGKRSSALASMFGRDRPSRKPFCRFTSLPVSFERARCFELIAEPWPSTGTIGRPLIMRDIVFNLGIRAELNVTLSPPGTRLLIEVSGTEYCDTKVPCPLS